jgi:hypothetical protein
LDSEAGMALRNLMQVTLSKRQAASPQQSPPAPSA